MWKKKILTWDMSGQVELSALKLVKEIFLTYFGVVCLGHPTIFYLSLLLLPVVSFMLRPF